MAERRPQSSLGRSLALAALFPAPWSSCRSEDVSCLFCLCSGLPPAVGGQAGSAPQSQGAQLCRERDGSRGGC